MYDNITNITPRGGIARYFRQIVPALGTAAAGAGYVTVYSTVRYEGSVARYIRAIPSRFRGSRLLKIRDINDWRASRLVERLRPELTFNAYYGPVLGRGLHVFTIYDMIHELFPQYFRAATATLHA